jgi:hypothetical protein
MLFVTVGSGTIEDSGGTMGIIRKAVLASVPLAAVLATATMQVQPAAAETNCDSNPWKELEVAHEIIDIGSVYTHPRQALPTYKGSGDNPIPDDVWNAGYAPPSPYIANTTRNLQFNESQFIASPGQPICSTAYVTTSDGYTWGAMSEALNALWPYDADSYTGLASRNAYYAGNLVETPLPGVVKVTANYKAQNMKFWANEDDLPAGTPGATPLPRYFIRDRWGNQYVMHASGQDTPEAVAQAFDDAVLPKGWTKFTRNLSQDLYLHPAEGADGSFHYLVVRDSADNTYHQIKWSKRGGSLQAVVDGGAMPVWGGQTSDLLKGTAGNDLIHAAGGNDRIRPGRGRDVIWGDAGVDTVILPGKTGRYRITGFSHKKHSVKLGRRGSRLTLRYVERIRFRNATVRVSSLRHHPGGRIRVSG